MLLPPLHCVKFAKALPNGFGFWSCWTGLLQSTTILPNSFHHSREHWSSSCPTTSTQFFLNLELPVFCKLSIYLLSLFFLGNFLASFWAVSYLQTFWAFWLFLTLPLIFSLEIIISPSQLPASYHLLAITGLPLQWDIDNTVRHCFYFNLSIQVKPHLFFPQTYFFLPFCNQVWILIFKQTGILQIPYVCYHLENMLDNIIIILVFSVTCKTIEAAASQVQMGIYNIIRIDIKLQFI